MSQRSLVAISLISLALVAPAQDPVQIRPDRAEALEFLGETMAYAEWDSTAVFPNERTKQERLGFHAKNDWYLHKEWRSEALPQGMDPDLQSVAPLHSTSRAVDVNSPAPGCHSADPSRPRATTASGVASSDCGESKIRTSDRSMKCE